MDVILHVGAQRTATTTLQSYMRAHASELAKRGVGVWGPLRTRHGGLLSGVAPEPGEVVNPLLQDQARRRISDRIEKAQRRGRSHLLVSDENMVGTIRRNLRGGVLYEDAEERLALFAKAFDGAVTRIVMSVRAQDCYWPSAWAYAVARGYRLPGAGVLKRTVAHERSWQAVVADVRRAFPRADLLVMEHSGFAGCPDVKLAHMLGGEVDTPRPEGEIWRHRSPELPELRQILKDRGDDPDLLPQGQGTWSPFDTEQSAHLHETYQDDLFWLHAGAGGIARYIEEDQPDQTGDNLSGGATTRGPRHDRQDGRLARAG